MEIFSHHANYCHTPTQNNPNQLNLLSEETTTTAIATNTTATIYWAFTIKNVKRPQYNKNNPS
jgi:hypothetical protein